MEGTERASPSEEIKGQIIFGTEEYLRKLKGLSGKRKC